MILFGLFGIAIIAMIVCSLLPDDMVKSTYYYRVIKEESHYEKKLGTRDYIFTLENGDTLFSTGKPYYKVGQCLEVIKPDWVGYKTLEVQSIVNDSYCRQVITLKEMR